VIFTGEDKFNVFLDTPVLMLHFCSVVRGDDTLEFLLLSEHLVRLVAATRTESCSDVGYEGRFIAR